MLQLLLLGSIWLTQHSLRAEDFARAIPISFEPFVPITPVSDAFRSQTSDAAKTIPHSVWRQVEAAGWRVRLAEFTVDAHPILLEDRPRGWPADTSWLNIDAALLPTERLLVLAEKRRNRRGQVVPTARVAGVLRHELGHAFDAVTGSAGRYRSRSPDFQAAYDADRLSITPERQTELAYYLQPDDAGRQETYAEAFGILLGGGSDSPHQASFEATFQHVLQLVSVDLGRHR